jgi:phosphodiesterase/alkaline phosphatase D-like protein
MMFYPYGAQSEMAMSWVTEEETRTSKVQYGTSRTVLEEEAWSAIQGQYNFKNQYVSDYIHKVILRDLLPGTRYFYRVGDDSDGWSPVYWFKTRENSYDSTVRLAALADQVRRYPWPVNHHYLDS